MLRPGAHGPEIEFVGDIASLVMTTLPEQQNTAPEGAAVDRFHSSARAVEGCNHQQRAICVDVQVQIGDTQPPLPNNAPSPQMGPNRGSATILICSSPRLPGLARANCERSRDASRGWPTAGGSQQN